MGNQIIAWCSWTGYHCRRARRAGRREWLKWHRWKCLHCTGPTYCHFEKTYSPLWWQDAQKEGKEWMETFGGKESTRIPKEESKTLRSQTLPKRNLHAQPHMGRMTQRLPLKKNETCGLPPKKDPKAQLQTSMGCIIIWKGYTTYMEMKDETKGQSEFSPTSFSLYILQLFWALFLCHLYMPAIPLSLSLNLPKALRPSHQSSSLSSNGSYGRASLPTGVPSLGYQDPRFGFDGTRSLIPLADMFSDGQSKHVPSVGLSSPISHANNFPSGRNQNFCPVPQLMCKASIWLR